MIRSLKSILAATLTVLTTVAFSQVVGTEQTTGNIITNNWSGVVPYSGTGAGYSGGNVPGYNSSNNTIYFGYTQSTVAQSIAINQALSGSGIMVNGYNWSWTITNGNIGGTTSVPGTLTANINTFSNTGSLLHNFSQNYSGVINNQTFSGSQTYATPYQLSTLGNLSVQFSGKDGSFWAGYYGPQVSNVNIGLRYGADPCTVDPQSSPSCPGYRTYYTFGDDTYAHVPLPFGFPFYGRTFTNSWMHSNGVVGFLDPMSPIEGGSNPGAWAYCCGGPNLSQETIGYGAQFNYTIAPFWTDLYPGPDSKFYTTQDSTYIKYHWEKIPDISNGNNLNTFSLELRPSGYIGATYGTIMSQQTVTIGTIGDLRLGEKTHQFFGVPVAGGIGNWSLNSTQAADCSNPLNSPYCPGYAEAYLSQQCTISSLYSPQCPGYATAYFTQQCTANPLYDVNCPGYATAYYNYQCSVNPLYHTGCPGYETAYFNQQCSLNTLYNSQCPGYETAYFNQQCGLNPLYNNQCPGYADAYYVQQCTANPLYDSGCTGYAQAYFNQQCSLNSLYSNQCPGYAQAYFNQQCSLNSLYSNQCPGYAQAYFNQQCSISPLYNNQCPGYAEAYFAQQCSIDGLYNSQCPNYAEAYAKKNILNIGSSPTNNSNTSTPTASTTIIVSTNTVSDPVAQAAPVVSDPVVNNVVTTKSTATTSAAAPTAVVPLTPPAPSPTAVASVAKEEKKEEKKTETASTSTTTTTSSTSTENKDQPKTNRQALAERRLEAARAKAIEEGKQLANKMGEAATIEAQVAVQNVVVQAMGFTPGFDAYGKLTLPDAMGYKPFEIYAGQRNIDNPAGRRFMTGSDRLHNEMVDQQYNFERNR